MITQVPTPMKETTPLLIEHTEDALASMVNATIKPDVEVAVGVYVAPPTFAAPGAVDVNVIVWSSLSVVKETSAPYDVPDALVAYART